MNSASVVNPRTLQAYRETEYRVHGQPGFTLKVGQSSAELLFAHKRHKTDCSVFLTACNPYSESADEAVNEARQAALIDILSTRSLSFLAGIGQHPTNGWPGESSLLVFGLTLEAAKTLGTQFEQNAIVWCGADATPNLILLR